MYEKILILNAYGKVMTINPLDIYKRKGRTVLFWLCSLGIISFVVGTEQSTNILFTSPIRLTFDDLWGLSGLVGSGYK